MVKPPSSKEQYEARFNYHYIVAGQGADVIVHMPCPFCAARDFLIYRLEDVAVALGEPATCRACGRSGKALVTEDESGGVDMEYVITGGDDPPDFLPAMRRVEA